MIDERDEPEPTVRANVDASGPVLVRTSHQGAWQVSGRDVDTLVIEEGMGAICAARCHEGALCTTCRAHVAVSPQPSSAVNRAGDRGRAATDENVRNLLGRSEGQATAKL
jgi:hypothetical protein